MTWPPRNRLGPARLAGKTILSPAFQYQYLPDNWKINYYGLMTEFYFSEKISVSGPVLIGNALISFGGGLQIKAFLSRHFMFSSHATLKYFFVGDKNAVRLRQSVWHDHRYESGVVF